MRILNMTTVLNIEVSMCISQILRIRVFFFHFKITLRAEFHTIVILNISAKVALKQFLSVRRSSEWLHKEKEPMMILMCASCKVTLVSWQ